MQCFPSTSPYKKASKSLKFYCIPRNRGTHCKRGWSIRNKTVLDKSRERQAWPPDDAEPSCVNQGLHGCLCTMTALQKNPGGGGGGRWHKVLGWHKAWFRWTTWTKLVPALLLKMPQNTWYCPGTKEQVYHTGNSTVRGLEVVKGLVTNKLA